MNIYQGVELLSELLQCGDHLYLWCYDREGNLQYSSCPDGNMLDTAFTLFDGKRLTAEHGERHDTPIIVGTAFGLQWAAAFEKNSSADLSPDYSAITGQISAEQPRAAQKARSMQPEEPERKARTARPDDAAPWSLTEQPDLMQAQETPAPKDSSGPDPDSKAPLHRFWVIGPFFYQEISEKGIREGLGYYRDIEMSVAWRKRFPEALQGLPVVQHMQICRYLLMLHYCLTGEHLEISDIASPLAPSPYNTSKESVRHDGHRTWQTEQAILQMVRDGDRNYRKVLSEGMGISDGVPIKSDDPLRQAKTSLVVFTTLVSRAAIEGGLSPEIAYSLSDKYIQSAESAGTTTDLDALGPAMYDDFVHRVYKVKSRPDYSPEVKRCVDYIELHPEERIRAADLSGLVGYSEYYITRLFHKETGMSVSDYVRRVKIDAAKSMLKTSDLTAQEIADRLCFSSRNYFSKCFADVTGMTPTQFRETRG